MAAAQVCPVVGTTNTVLPPKHPDFDMNQPGLVCPVTKATTDHHHHLSKHPGIFGSSVDDLANAESCPALSKIVSRPEQQAMDEAICPVVGTVSSVLPPNHPSTDDAKDGDVCPVTNATLGHHKGKVHQHPNVANAAKGAVCPVVGAAGKA
ncbi:uncharacterized protein Z518_02250 [Rhinocladiella mackenziei CBS 650.93]|uniref:Uncharacterized protein n=1 Tax=Rhinocladiella mackenziei CBS 650.93 TaxID=1442369 RepID=A0A0D2FZ94_9EURO|nr:uncharacterized protein Z518_02250 [Rhinocladiella mackenziei CBS 650.93]KIX07597.1 hypothetical protein Z518_02250 [Rhinocladiella mackenziei CBS 650.93]